MNSSVKLGIIGVGMVSQIAHIPAFINIPDAEIIALADHNTEIARIIANKYGIKNVYDSHISLLNQQEIDAVVVVVNRHKAYPVIYDALSSNKHVFAEKPMSLSLDSARTLHKLAIEKKKHLAIGYMKRHDLGVKRAKQILEQSDLSGLGKLVSVRCRNYCNKYVGFCDDYVKRDAIKKTKIDYSLIPDWITKDYHQKYDWFVNVCSHSIDLVQFLFGKNMVVNYADFSKLQSAIAVLDVGGVPVIVDAGEVATGQWEDAVEFYFENGRMKIQFTSLMQRDRSATLLLDRVDEVGRRQIETFHGPWSFSLQAVNFIEALLGRSQLKSTSESGLRTAEMIEEMWRFSLSTSKFCGQFVATEGSAR